VISIDCRRARALRQLLFQGIGLPGCVPLLLDIVGDEGFDRLFAFAGRHDQGRLRLGELTDVFGQLASSSCRVSKASITPDFEPAAYKRKSHKINIMELSHAHSAAKPDHDLT
jgi:hypothetical protein